ncbi:MAG: hypothetical protein ACRDSR_17455 [Pseudonocardiaceae bacterium]
MIADIHDVIEVMPSGWVQTVHVTGEHVPHIVRSLFAAETELTNHQRGGPIRGRIDVEHPSPVERGSEIFVVVPPHINVAPNHWIPNFDTIQRRLHANDLRVDPEVPISTEVQAF